MFGIKTYAFSKVAKIRVWLEFCSARLGQRVKRLPPADKNILFTLADERRDEEIPRHYYLMLNFFAEAGYNVYVYKKPSFRFFKRLGPMGGRYLYSVRNVKFITALPERTDEVIYAFDHEDPDEAMLARKWKKLVYFNSLKPASWKVGRGAVWMPYPMSPYVYRSGASRRLETFRRNRRKLRALFVGNTKKEYYDNPALKKYGQLTRLEALKVLRSSGRKFVDRPDARELDRLLNGEPRQECVISDYSKLKIDPDRWLDVLSRSDFFICLSGADYPMCHNCVEAAAVGTIPILSYADWFNPPMEHRQNAIVYSGAEDLPKKIDEVMGLSVGEIEKMRNNVIQYYEDHLSPRSFVRQFESRPEAHTVILLPKVLCAEPYPEGCDRLERLNARIAANDKDLAHAQ